MFKKFVILLAIAAVGRAASKAEGEAKGPIPQTEKDGGTSTSYFRFYAKNIPHHSKRHKGGEDAWVASSNILAVADGVGGWERHGVDSGLFSKQLVLNIKSIFDQNEAQELKNVLGEAVTTNGQTGSSTAVLAEFDTSQENFIKTTNLGDSGYTILRPLGEGKFEQIFRSKEQQYSFNFPYQCGTGAELAAYEADDNQHEVQDDDVIILASDGVYDNLFDADVMYCAEPKADSLHLPFDHKRVGDCLANMALKLGETEGYRSPFAIGAQAAGRNYPDIGKSDDIAVIVATVHKKKDKEFDQQISTNAMDTDAKDRKK